MQQCGDKFWMQIGQRVVTGVTFRLTLNRRPRLLLKNTKTLFVQGYERYTQLS